MAHFILFLADIFCFFFLLCKRGNTNYPFLDPAHTRTSFFFVFSSETQVYWFWKFHFVCCFFSFIGVRTNNSVTYLTISSSSAKATMKHQWKHLWGLIFWNLSLPPLFLKVAISRFPTLSVFGNIFSKIYSQDKLNFDQIWCYWLIKLSM